MKLGKVEIRSLRCIREVNGVVKLDPRVANRLVVKGLITGSNGSWSLTAAGRVAVTSSEQGRSPSAQRAYERQIRA